MLDTLLAGVTTSLSAAKRYRLQCLQAAVLSLLSPGAPRVRLPALVEDGAKSGGEGGGEETAMSGEEERRQVRCLLQPQLTALMRMGRMPPVQEV